MYAGAAQAEGQGDPPEAASEGEAHHAPEEGAAEGAGEEAGRDAEARHAPQAAAGRPEAGEEAAAKGFREYRQSQGRGQQPGGAHGGARRAI